ncbi:MAG: aminopeptidase [Candidatus Tectomicrobia bacterium]|nr:aminopeptidase [Candidatus Tectomicrobia bacterium]
MPSMMDRMETAHLCIDTCLGVKEGEKVLVIVDQEHIPWGEALAAAAAIKGATPAIALIPEPRPYQKEPNDMIVAAMNAADVAIAALSDLAINQFVHTKARKDALARGVRFGNFMAPEPGERVTAKELLETKARADRLAARLTAAKRARVTTALGTDVSMSLEGRKGYGIASICTEKGFWASMPNFSESAVSPLEGTAEGLAVIDGMVNWIGFVREPIRLTMEKGVVAKVSGGADAERLKAIWDQADDNAANVAELGIGTVPNERPRGNNQDKRLIGTAHFGIGDNYSLGGTVRSKMHLDALMYGVTVDLDGEAVVKDGKFLA